MTDEQFIPMSKIPRLRREVIVTEKIDGTNASVHVYEDGTVRAASRTRWLRPRESDNFGFAAWVRDNEDELRLLGPGHHFGEWWGSGIQRTYGLTKGERRFSLFNVGRWLEEPAFLGGVAGLNVRAVGLPACCDVVPRIWQGPWDDFIEQNVIGQSLLWLRAHGSYVTQFANPEGIVIYHVAAKQLFKVTCEDDDVPKGAAKAA